jgi:heat shock protein HtpX
VPYVRGNVLRTAMLLATLSGLILAMGVAFGRTTGLVLALVIVFWVNGIALFAGDKIALAAMRARPVSEVEYPQLYRLVRELSTAARQPVPRLYISPAMQPNAFAVGRNRRKAVICCTEGMLQVLDADEMRAVLGHELAHVHNGDTLSSSAAAGLATVITLLAGFAWLLLLPFGRVGGRAGARLLEVLLMLVLGPLAALMILLAVSRGREYQADSAGALLTGDAFTLARALRKIELGTTARPLTASGAVAAVGHMMIVGPFRAEGFGRLFSSHPPVAERCRRLEALAGASR